LRQIFGIVTIPGQDLRDAQYVLAMRPDQIVKPLGRFALIQFAPDPLRLEHVINILNEPEQRKGSKPDFSAPSVNIRREGATKHATP